MPETKHFYTDGKTLKGIDLPQYPDSAWNWITGSPEDTKDEELYSRVAAVYRVANLSADAIANVPFAVYKGKTEFDTSDDWQNKIGFLKNPRELMRLWRLSLFMTNSAYGFMEGNRAVRNMRYVKANSITPVTDKWEGLTGFKRQLGTETTEYNLNDNRIFWMWRLDHTTELLPSKNSEFRALMAAAGVLYYADYYVQNFFQRGGIRPALLQVAGVPTREEREKIETVWDKIIHGWSKYLGKVISANEMDVKVIGDGIDNVANGQIHSEKLADVAMAAGMPLSIILANSANYATAQTEYIVWFRDSVIPWVNFMEDSLNEKLFKPLGYRFEFRPEMSDKGQEEERQRAGAYRAYVASGMKPSIAAQVVGIDLPPDIEYADLDDAFVLPTQQPVNETEIPIEKEEEPEAEMEKSVTLLTIDQLRELEHWQDLAFRKLKQGKSLSFPWVSKTLPEEVASVIRERLPACKTLAEIERAFDLNMPDTPDRHLRELADALNRAVEAVEVKYSPDQPRVPAGDPEGGQWTDGGGGDEIYNAGIGFVSKVKAGTVLPDSLTNHLRKLDEPVRVIYNIKTQTWHIARTGVMTMQHGDFLIDALEGETPEYTEQIQTRGVFDITDGTMLMYDFSDQAEFIGGIGAERRTLYVIKEARRQTRPFYYKTENGETKKIVLVWDSMHDGKNIKVYGPLASLLKTSGSLDEAPDEVEA